MTKENEGAVSKVANAINLGASLTTVVSAVAPAIIPLVAGGTLLAFLGPAVPLTFLGVALASALLVGGVAITWSTYHRNRRLSTIDSNAEWKFIKNDRTVVVRSRQHIDYEHEIAVRARRSNLDTLKWTTAWTGTGKYEVISRTSGVRVSEDFLHNTFGERYRLVRSVGARRGEVVDFNFTIRTTGDKEEQKPFLAITIRNLNWPPHENLVTVRFEKPVEIERVWLEVYVEGLPWPQSSTEVPLDMNREAVVKFRPRLGRKFVICWSYMESFTDE